MDVQNETITMMENARVVLYGHFKLTSGVHSDTYIQKDRVWQDPKLMRHIVFRLKQRVLSVLGSYEVQMPINEYHQLYVVGPAAAGTPWAAITAHELNLRFAYCEKTYVDFDDRTIHDVRMQFGRGFDKAIKDKPVVVVEDIITSGGSVNKTLDAIRECGGRPAAVVCIWNRSNFLYAGNKNSAQGVPIESCVRKEVPHWKPSECPLCKEGMTLNDSKI